MKEYSQSDIRNFFNQIAKKYDFMNNVISLGLHNKARQLAIQDLCIKPQSKVLDLCCGTGDFGKLINNCEVIGVDNSSKMLEIAREKNPNILYLEQDATNLEFLDNKFDSVVMGFGLRNIKNRAKVYSEITRVLKNGGYFLQLDFGRKNIVSGIYNFFVLLVVNFFLKDTTPYKYLINSKRKFLTPEEIVSDLEAYGFKQVKVKLLFFNVISYQILQKVQL